MFFHKKLITNRLILRKWLYSDLNNLYDYAKDEIIGQMSGWKPHTSIYYSEIVLKNTYLTKNHFAVALKENNQLIGSVSLIPNVSMSFPMSNNEAELGYWLGRPFWNKGYTTEAVLKVLDYGFKNKKYNRIWAGSLNMNKASLRVLEKCGFNYKYSVIKKFEPDITIEKKEDIFCINRSEWKKTSPKF